MVVLAAVGKGLDFDQGLTVQEQKDSGDTVSQRFAIAVNKLSQPCQTLLLGERAAGRLRWVICTDLFTRVFLAQANRFRIF